VLVRMLALGLEGGRVMLVDEATGEVRWAVQAHAGGTTSTLVAMSSKGGLVASAGAAEHSWKLWDCESGAQWMTGARHDGTGACICGVDELGDLLVHEGCLVIAHTAGLEALAISPCGQRLASGDNEGAVILWDAQTGEAERRMEADSGDLSLSFSADGVRLASGIGDGFIQVWESTAGTLLRTIHTPADILGSLDPIYNVHFSPTDSRMLASEGNNVIRLWDVDSGEMRWSFEGCYFAVFSPDGRTIATASDTTNDVLLVNAESGELRLRLVGHQQRASSACFVGRDGGKVASGSSDGTCKVWDSSTGALLRTIGVGQRLLSLAWGRDWVQDTQRGAAFAMGHQPRLGEESRVQGLDAGLVRMILDRV